MPFQKGNKLALGKKLSEHTKYLISIANSGKNNGMYGKPSWNKGIKGTMSHCYGHRHTEETRHKMSLKAIGRKFSKQHRKKLSLAKKNLFRNKLYIKKLIINCQIKPNKSECIFDSILNSITTDFKYNGDFSQEIIVGSRIPDWINCNGRKQVIEFFGEPWHKPGYHKSFSVSYARTKKGTMRHYKKYGFDCLIIWQSELRNKARLQEKLVNWMYKHGGNEIGKISDKETGV